MDYGFFDYKYDISGFDSDLFSTPHLIYVALVYLLALSLCLLRPKADPGRIRSFLKLLFVISALLEIAKISWESYYDITTGRGFNKEGLLPLYTCSLFIFTLPFAAWGKGAARRAALAFLTTICPLYGAIGVVYCNGLNFYPFWTFGAFYSLYFHSTMFLTGVFLLCSGYHRLRWSDALWQMIPILLLCLVAIPVNHAFGSDYMMIYSGSGLPLYEELAASLAARGLRFVYTGIMILTHIPLAALVVGVYRLISKKSGDS